MVEHRDYNVVFDGSWNGFLCVVYAYYYDGVNPLIIQTEEDCQAMLETEAFYVATDDAKAARALGGIKKRICDDAAGKLYGAYLSGEDEKYMDMFRYVLLGFKKGAAVVDNLQEACVKRVHKLAGYVGRESHLLSGFCRFAETRQGVYYCAISPTNHVLGNLAEHFKDRFLNHAWVIHDRRHGLAAVYDGYEYVIAEVPKDAKIQYAEAEEEFQDLWQAFYDTIAIKERATYKRKRQVLPLKYRGMMLEQVPRFKKSGEVAAANGRVYLSVQNEVIAANAAIPLIP